MTIRRGVAWLGRCAIAAAAIAHVDAQSNAQPPGAAAPQFKSGVALLRVDASVVDESGRALGDLTPADFHVTLDGKPRKVAFAQFTGTTSAPATAPPPSASTSYAVNTQPGGGRAIALMIDLENIRAGSERSLLDTAAQLIDRLRPVDAAAVVPLPGRSIDLTRDHRRIADGIRNLRGTSQASLYRYAFTLEEALAFERQDKRVIAEVIERECSRNIELARAAADTPLPPLCPPQLERDAKERLARERLHVQMVLSAIASLANQLRNVQAPASIVLISGGLGFDEQLLARYQEVQRVLKDTGVSIATVQVHQPEVDASTSTVSEAAFYSGSGRESGLANAATMSGGQFYQGIATATGVFERLRTELTETYELGLEAEPGDLDGKPHELRVTTARKANVRARRYLTVSKPPADWTSQLANLLQQPVDVGDLPIALATHAVRGDEATTLKVLIRGDIGRGVMTTPPIRYAAVVIAANDAVAANLTGTASLDGGVLISTQLAPGRYRVRIAAIEGGGRTGTLEIPLVAGLRPVGGFLAGDLIVGTVSGQSLTPAIYAPAGSPLIPTLEMTTADSARFGLASVGFEIRRSGSDDVVAAGTGRLEETPYDRQQIARGTIPTSGLATGEYTLSAVISIDGQPAGRVSRTFVLEPAVSRPTLDAAPAPAAAEKKADTSAAAPVRIADPLLDDVMHKAAAYVASYGEQMSAVVGVEKYIQNVNPVNGGVAPRPREIIAEFALVKSGGPIRWTGYRDVIEVNGEPIHDRRDRILKILTESGNPAEEAARLTAESARYNIGPVSRNFNLPTTALFFFDEANLARFTFTRKGTKTINGVDTVEIAFRETARPTLVITRSGADVPCEGTLWIVPADGTIVRTRLQFKGFADTLATGDTRTPAVRIPPTPQGSGSVTAAPAPAPAAGTSSSTGSTSAGSTGGRGGATAGDSNAAALRSRFMDFPDPSVTRLDSTADIDVTYQRDKALGMWLPARMTEEYQGAIPRLNNPPILAIARSSATYSDYKRFGTSSTVIGVKK